MIKITGMEDLDKIQNADVVPYIKNLLEYLLKEYSDYCPNGSIESIGVIFFLESGEDLKQYTKLGLSSPITESQLEWVVDIGHGYLNACIVLDNDRAINIIGKAEYFSDIISHNRKDDLNE